MSNMTRAEAQAMVEDVLVYERKLTEAMASEQDIDEQVETEGEELDEAGAFTGYKGRAAHQKALAALDKKIAVIDRLEDQNMRTESIIEFVKMFTKGEKDLVAAAKGLLAIHNWMGSLPPGANEIRLAMWKRAARAASKQMDFSYYKILKDRLHLPV